MEIKSIIMYQTEPRYTFSLSNMMFMGLLYTQSIVLICSTNVCTQSQLYSASRPRVLLVRVLLYSPTQKLPIVYHNVCSHAQ